MKISGLEIPSGDKKEVVEIESWTIHWQVSSAIDLGYARSLNKCFISENEANLFMEQLKVCAKFIGTPIEIRKEKN